MICARALPLGVFALKTSCPFVPFVVQNFGLPVKQMDSCGQGLGTVSGDEFPPALRFGAPHLLFIECCMNQDVIEGKRILIVDDDPSVRESIKLLLSIDRHTVTEARNGMEALDLVAGQYFDLVLLDFFMPGMHGGEVARRIKEIEPSLPILLVTAYCERLMGYNRPSAVLGKPFAMNELRDQISKLVPGRYTGQKN